MTRRIGFSVACAALISAATWLALAPSAVADGTVAGTTPTVAGGTPTPECTTYYPSSVPTGSDIAGGSASATAVSGGTDTGVVQTDTTPPDTTPPDTTPPDTTPPDSTPPDTTPPPTDTVEPTDTTVPSGPVTACVLGEEAGGSTHQPVARTGNDTGLELSIAAALLVLGVGLSVLTGRRSARRRVH